MSFFKSIGKTLNQLLIGGIIGLLLLLIIVSYVFDHDNYIGHIEKPSLPLQPESQAHYASGNIDVNYFRRHYKRLDSLLTKLQLEERLKLSGGEALFLEAIRDYQQELEKHLEEFLNTFSEQLKEIYILADYKPEDPIAGLPLENKQVGHILFFYRENNFSFVNRSYWQNNALRRLAKATGESDFRAYPSYPPAPDFFDYIALHKQGNYSDRLNGSLASNYFMHCTLIEGVALHNLLHHQIYYELYRLQRYFILQHLSPYQEEIRPRIMTLDLTEGDAVKKQRLYSLLPLETQAPIQAKWEAGGWQKLSATQALDIPLQEQGRLHLKLYDPYFKLDTEFRLQKDAAGQWQLK